MRLVENTTVFQALGAQLIKKLFPGCEGHVPRSNAYFECYARHFSVSAISPTCTCPMGRRGSPNAVLDSKLRVQGLGGLRVIDASIMPTVVSTNSQAACMVIGEVGADMILTTWAENEQNELYV